MSVRRGVLPPVKLPHQAGEPITEDGVVGRFDDAVKAYRPTDGPSVRDFQMDLDAVLPATKVTELWERIESKLHDQGAAVQCLRYKTLPNKCSLMTLTIHTRDH